MLLRNDHSPVSFPMLNPYGHVAFQAQRGDVHTVLVDGRVVKHEHRLVGVDLAAIRREVEDTVEYLRSTLGEEAWAKGMYPDRARPRCWTTRTSTPTTATTRPPSRLTMACTHAGLAMAITDDEMRQLLPTTREYTVVILRAGPERDRRGRGRDRLGARPAQLPAPPDGQLAVVCPVVDDSEVAGIGIFSTGVDEPRAIMDGDRACGRRRSSTSCTRAVGFPGDRLPG